MDLGRLAGGCGVDPFGSGEGPAEGCFVYGDEPSGSGATELVSYEVVSRYNTCRTTSVSSCLH
jgi:hypothetical protein